MLHTLLVGVSAIVIASSLPAPSPVNGSPAVIASLGGIQEALGDRERQWQLSGSASSVGNSIELVPITPKSMGYVIHRDPLPVNSFEVEVAFKVKPSQINGSSTQGFALWYVFENNVESFLNSVDKSLFGYKSNFAGLSAFFAVSDRSGNLRPSISAAVSDGTRTWNPSNNVPTNDGVYYDFRNVEYVGDAGAIFTLKVDPIAATVTGKLQRRDPKRQDASASTVINTFTIKDVQLAANGYFAVTGSNTSPHNAQKKFPSDSITILSIKVHGLGPSTVDGLANGSQQQLQQQQQQQQGGVMDKMPQMQGMQGGSNQQDKTNSNEEAVVNIGSELARVLSVLETSAAETSVKLTAIQQSVQVIRTEQTRITAELNRQMTEMKTNVSNLNKESEESLVRRIGYSRQDVMKLANSSKQLENTIRQHYLYSLGVSVVVILTVSGIGFVMYRQLREASKTKLF